MPTDDSEAGPPTSETRPTLRWRWIYSTILLCSYGFFKEFLPSEPYLTAYLDNETNASKQFDFDDVNNEIYPWWPYSYLVAVFVLFLFTDLLRYKPIVIVEFLSQIVTRVLLIWGTTLLEMKLMQVTYGIATAAEIAYYSYIYVLVSPLHFRKVTGYIEASRLFGAALAGYAAQALVSTGAFNLLQLQYISFSSVCLGCLFALALPNVWYPSCRAIFTPDEGKQRAAPCAKLSSVVRSATRNRWQDFKRFYTVPSLLRWSVWWALATCGCYQVQNYVQSQWSEIASSTGTTYQYNGLVEATAVLFGSLGALSVSFLRVNWSVWGEVVIAALSLVESGSLLLSTFTEQLWVAYVCYVIFTLTYYFLVTIATTQIAHAMTHESYAMIYGFNTFMSLLLQTFLTLAVSDSRGLNLDIPTQFMVYSGYFFILFLIYAVAGICRLSVTGWITSFRLCCQEAPLLVLPKEGVINKGFKEFEGPPPLDEKRTKEDGQPNDCGDFTEASQEGEHLNEIIVTEKVIDIDDVKC